MIDVRSAQRSLRRSLSMIVMCGFVSSCAVPTGGWKNPVSQWAGIDEVAILKDLYDDSNRLSKLSSKNRVREYRSFKKNLGESPSLQEHLHLALFLSGIDSSLIDYKRAKQELTLALAQPQSSSSPLLSSYIHSQLGLLSQLSKSSRSSRRTIVKCDQQRSESPPLLDQSCPDEHILVGQVSDLEMQIKQRDIKISELEAKIQALSAIERSLNQRTR
jgi:hypothetical protein